MKSGNRIFLPRRSASAAAAAAAAAFLAAAPRGSAEPLEGRLWFAGSDASAVQICSRGFYEDWIADRLTVGLRLGVNRLTDGKRPGNYREDFIGAIYRLDDEDETVLFPEISYWVARCLRVSLGCDSVSGRTRNFNTANRHSDGVANLAGPLLLVEGAWPMLDDTLFVHAGAGLAWLMGSFDYVTWWHLGYADQASWEYLGSPGEKTRADRYREIHVDDTVGVALAAGVAWRPIDRVEIDVSLRHVWAEPDCYWGYRHTRYFEKRQDGEFTLHHLQVSAMLSYVF